MRGFRESRKWREMEVWQALPDYSGRISGPVTPSHSRLSPVLLSVVCVDHMMCLDTWFNTAQPRFRSGDLLWPNSQEWFFVSFCVGVFCLMLTTVNGVEWSWMVFPYCVAHTLGVYACVWVCACVSIMCACVRVCMHVRFDCVRACDRRCACVCRLVGFLKCEGCSVAFSCFRFLPPD